MTAEGDQYKRERDEARAAKWEETANAERAEKERLQATLRQLRDWYSDEPLLVDAVDKALGDKD